MRKARQRIRDNLSWLGLQEVIARISGIALVVILSRALTADEYGSLNICIALMTMLGLLVRSGTGSRATRMIARHAEDLSRIYPQIVGLRVTMVVAVIFLLAIFVQPISGFFSIPAWLLLLGSGLLLRPALTVAWAFRGMDRLRPVAFAAGGERILVLAGVMFLLAFQLTSVYMVMLLEVSAGLFVVFYLRRSLRSHVGALPAVSFQFRRWGDMLRESLPISFAAITASLYRHGDVLLLGVLSSGSAAALYLIPQKLVLTLLIPAILAGKASFPSASREMTSGHPAAVETQGDLFQFTLLLLLPMCSLAWFFAPQLLQLIFGSAYADADDVLRILLLTVPLYAFTTFQENLLLAVPRPRTVMWCRIVSSIFHLLISFILIPEYGVPGAAIGCLCGQLLFSILTAAMWKLGGEDLPLQYRGLAVLAASVAMLLLLYACPPAWTYWQLIALSILLYLVLVVLLGGLRRSDILKLVS